MKEHFIARLGRHPGRRHRRADRREPRRSSSEAGFDGVLLSWARYIEDMRRFEQEVHPMLIQAGLR